MGALVVIATLAVAWVWFDRKSMAPMEHYGWEGWWLVFLPGACMAVVLWVAGQGVNGARRLVRRAVLSGRSEFRSRPHSTPPGPPL